MLSLIHYHFFIIILTAQNQEHMSTPQAIAFQLLNDSHSTDNDSSDVADSCPQNGSSSDIQINDVDDDDDLNDVDEEDEEDENEDDNYEFMLDDCYDLRSVQKRRYWDEEYVLKRQFSALIPAFDPRPGRTNVNQTVDLVIQSPSSDPFEPLPCKLESESLSLYGKSKDSNPKMLLSIRMSSASSDSDFEIDLINPSWTLFAAIQQLLQASLANARQQKVVRAWEPTYKLVYKEWPSDHKEINPNLPIHQAPIRLVTSSGSSEMICSNEANSSISPIEDTLQLLRILYQFRVDSVADQSIVADEANKSSGLKITSEDFVSKKITNKLLQQLQDPLVIASGAQPFWCDRLMHQYPMLFPFDSRQSYFQAIAFGTSRTIVWLQSQKDNNRLHGPSPRREEHEFRLGRLLHERVKVPRSDRLLHWAVEVMQKTAHKKSILEVEFQNEEGTGLGPTLEFYSLVALDLQQKMHKMWICSDTLFVEKDGAEENHVSDDYVHHSCGLFPAPLPPTHPTTMRVCQLFHFLGVFIGKALQDGRLVDLPLSIPFLKLLCNSLPEVDAGGENTSVAFDQNADVCVLDGKESKARRMLNALSPDEQLIRQRGEVAKQAHSKAQQFADKKVGSFGGVLNESDFALLFPHQATFFEQLRSLMERKQQIQYDSSLSLEEKQCQLRNLYIPTLQSDAPIRLEDLALTFQYLPTSRVYGFDAIDLKPSGEFEDLTIENLEEYYDSMLNFCLNAGISQQMEAFRSGFNRVFPIEKLLTFQPEELRLMLCGEQNPHWTKEEIIAYTEPKLGFTKNSPGFLKLVNVLCDLDGSERKAFLQFATGCSSLPPGGLANLHPRLTIVKKVDATDGSYPSVNTCAHYLKLPDYSSEQVLRQRLLHATNEKGFHLN
jgi:E3 ubiquitin-protein ligase HECTD1